jgi:microcystin degradation protein MlrC
VTLPLGGHATGFFAPLSVTGTVRAVGGGVVKVSKHNQLEVDQGKAVIFETGPVTMLLTELRAVAGNLPEVYRALGVEPEGYKMVVLKTASNFQYFMPIASEVIRVDTPGPGQSDIKSLPWQRQPRPVYPLDAIESWRG